MKNGTCQICLAQGYVELHHTIFRSQASYMRNIKVNLAELCQEHHRGSSQGVHQNKKMDLRLKKQLQDKLYQMFAEKKHYSKEEIQEILECTNFDATLICKKLCLYRVGYEKEQIIRRLMGGRLYE